MGQWVPGTARGCSSPAPCSNTELFVLKLERPWHFWPFNVLPCISLLCIVGVFILIYRDSLKILTCNTLAILSLTTSGVGKHSSILLGFIRSQIVQSLALDSKCPERESGLFSASFPNETCVSPANTQLRMTGRKNAPRIHVPAGRKLRSLPSWAT